MTPSTPPFDRRSRWIAALASAVIGVLAFGMLIARLTGVGASAQGYEEPPPPPTGSDVYASVRAANNGTVLIGGRPDQVVAATELLEADPAVAMDGQGNFVVVWTARSPAAASSDIRASHFADGRTSGSFSVVTTAANETDPSVAMAADGRFVITYTSAGSVRARLYGTNRAAFKDMPVAGGAGAASESAVARRGDGRFAVAYRVGTAEIQLRTFDAVGAAVGQHVIAKTSLGARHPSLAIDSDGNSVVAWQELKSAGDWDVKSRKVSSTGVIQAVTTVSASTQPETRPAVATPSTTTVTQAVAYQTGPEEPTRQTGVAVKQLSSTGVARIGDDLGSGHSAPAMTVDGLGRYHVTYTSLIGPDDPGEGVFGRFWPSAQPAGGPEFHANRTTVGTQSQSAVASTKDGRSVIVWTHDASPKSDLDARLELKFGARDVAVSGPLVCGAGNQWLITVFVAQGRVRDDSRSRGMCTGDVQEWRARIAAARSGAFKPGSARSCARLTATDARGRVTQARRWCRAVTLVSEIAADDDEDDGDALTIVALVYGTLALLFGVAMFLRSRRHS